jgi:hypothetical protein
MKTMLEQSAQSRLDAREGVLCIVVETPFSAGASEASSPGMRQWFRIEEPDANPAQVGGRPVRNIDPQEGLFIDEEGNSYRLSGGGHAEPFHAEVIPVEGGPGTRLKALPLCRSNGAAGMVADCQDGDAAKEGRGPPPLRTLRFQSRPPRAESAREVRRGPSAARLCPEARAQ